MNQYDKLNLLEQVVIRHAHPVAFILHVLSLLWGGYFLWENQLLYALLALIGLGVIGEIVALVDKNYLATARVGLNMFQNLLIYHTSWKNLIFHVIGFIIFVKGAWDQSVSCLFLAFSFILIGHIMPWMQHNREAGRHARAIGE